MTTILLQECVLVSMDAAVIVAVFAQKTDTHPSAWDGQKERIPSGNEI